MPLRSRNRAPTLAVVGGSALTVDPLGPQGRAHARADGRELDWSILMARAQSGDRGAYHRLLEEIAPYLRALAARRRVDAADIEDFVQDILLAVHAIRHTYDPARPFGPWLVTIANCRITDGLRRRTRRMARELPFDREHETFAEPQANFSEADSNARALMEEVEKLPPGQRFAVRLLKLEERSLKEAAAVSGRSIGALKVASHRALRTLKRVLTRRGHET